MTNSDRRPTITTIDNNTSVKIDPARLVALSKAGETRWGFHQFPSLSRLPDGRIICQLSSQLDAVRSYGNPALTLVSADNGETWQSFANENLPIAAPHSYISELFNGEFLYVPPTPPLDLNKTTSSLPEPVGGTFSYSANNFYLFDQCPDDIQKYAKTLIAYRWTPSDKTWHTDIINYDMQDALLWTRAKGEERDLVPRTWFEEPLLRSGNELFYADYRQRYLAPDGTVPKSFAVSCMVSTDNGRSFKRRSTIARDPSGEDSFGEPMLSLNAKGELVCVIRRTDHNQKPMAITCSKDQGRTWNKPVALHKFGVYPSMMLLDCGVMALAFGRPGVHISFSLDGIGHEWTEPLAILPREQEDQNSTTCGYTSILSLGRNEFLLAYSDFNQKNTHGENCKAIFVRKITLQIKYKQCNYR